MFTRGMKGVSIYGGSPYRPQEEALRSGVDVVVGTPGVQQSSLSTCSML